MAATQTYLQLAPEMGGLRFGPFQGPIQVGSDPRRNQIVLDKSHGIFPAHATLVETGGLYTVAPVQQGCQVFLAPQGQAQVWPVHSPVQARPGDVVIFGTPAGPRFQIQAVSAADRSAAQAIQHGAKVGGERGFLQAANGVMDSIFGPSKQRGIAGEIQRRARARMLTRSPWREIYGFWTRFRHGSLTSPMVIVSVLSAVGAALLGGGATCSGVLLAAWNALR